MEVELYLHVSIVPTETLFTAVFVYAQNPEAPTNNITEWMNQYTHT